MYGLTGANGKYPCLWCTISTQEMQVPKESLGNLPEKRTLEHFKDNLRKFQNEFGGDTKYAKQCFNVIPLTQVCLPDLHMTLGIFMKIFRDIIENYCADVDSKILEIQIKDDENNLCHNFGSYIGLIKQRRNVVNELHDIQMQRDLMQDEVVWFSISQDNFEVDEHQKIIASLDKEINQKYKVISSIDDKMKCEDTNGPCVKSLDVTLKEIGVERQAYYSNTITGNHCHILMKDENIIKL